MGGAGGGGGVGRGNQGDAARKCRLPGNVVANYRKAMEILEQWSNAGFCCYVGA
jgi:hypothetical protein